MAAINFPPNDVDPNPPQNGDTYSPPGLDTVYTYDNGVWTGGVLAGQQFMPLAGGNFTGDVTFNTDKIFLGTSGNANFAGDVDIDGNLALGSIADVEQAIIAASGGTPDAISNGSATLNFNGESILQSNTGYQPTLTNSYDLGASTFTWKTIYSNSLINTTSLDNTGDIRIGGSLPNSPNITLNSSGTGIYSGALKVGGDPADGANNGVVIDSSGTITSTRAANNIMLEFHTNGTTDPTTSINSNGNVTFVGDVTSGSLAGTGTVPVEVDPTGKLVRGSNITNDIWTENNSQIYPTDASDSVLIGGTLPSAPNISLSADGRIGTTNNVVIEPPAGGESNNFMLCSNNDVNKVKLNAEGSLALGGDLSDATWANNDPNITLNADGNASFAGTITSPDYDSDSATGKGFYIDPSGLIIGQKESDKGTQAIWQGRLGTNLTSQIKANGTATFNGQVDVGVGGGQNIGLKVQSAANGGGGNAAVQAQNTADGDLWCGLKADGTETSSISATGAAEFFKVTTQRDVDTDAALLVKNAAGDDVHVFYGNGNVTLANGEINFGSSGSGVFDSSITTGGDATSGTADGVKLNPTGVIYSSNTTANNPIFEGYTTGTSTATSSIKADGEAFFAARVSGNIDTIPDGAWDMTDSNLWTTEAATIVNPSGTTPGQSGLIYTTSTISGWGSYFKFPNDNIPTVPPNSVIPYYVTAQNVISMGNATEAIA